MISLLPYQVEPARITLNNLRKNGASLDASDMGTGKTYMGAWVAAELGLPVIVVCPVSVKETWIEVLGMAGIEDVRVYSYESLLQRTKKHKEVGEWTVKVVRSKKKYSWAWKVNTAHFIIFDECHRAKGEQTQMGALMRAGGQPVLMCSATMADNPLDMRSVGVQLGLFEDTQTIGPFRDWCRKQGAVPNHFNKYALDWPIGDPRPGTKRDGQVKTAQERLVLLHKRLFQGDDPKGVRLRKGDIPGFPSNQVVAELIHPVVEPKYENLRNVIQDLLDEDPAVSDLEWRIRERQLCELKKLPHYYELAVDAIEQGQSVVIFVNFLRSLDWLDRMFTHHKSIGSSKVCGSQNSGERQEQVDAFQDNKNHVIVLQIQAGGIGISLHDVWGKRPRMTLLSPPEKAIDMVQALGRTPRAGGRSHCYQRIIFCAGTIEEKVYDHVRDKIENIDRLNDGDLSFAPETTPNGDVPMTESMQSLADAAKNKPKALKKRTTRKAFVCHCGAEVASGDKFVTYPDGAKLADKPERFCGEPCYHKFVHLLQDTKEKMDEGTPAEDIEIPKTAFETTVEEFMIQAWGEDPWAFTSADTPYALGAKQILELSNVVAGPQDSKWVEQKVVEAFNGDPFDESPTPSFTKNDIARFVALIRPEPAKAPVPEYPDNCVVGMELVSGETKVAWFYKEKWNYGTYDVHHKKRETCFYVKPDDGGRRTLIDDDTHWCPIQSIAKDLEPMVDTDLEYPIESKHLGTITEPQVDPLIKAPVIEPVLEPPVPEQGAHHNYGPSSMLYREVCCGYDGNDDDDNEAATRGSIQHYVCEKAEDFNCFRTEGEYEGTPFTLDFWEIERVKEALEGVRQLYDYTRKEWDLPRTPNVFREHKLDIAGLTFGTVDLVFVWSGERTPSGEKFGKALIMDYKFGVIPVPPADINPQGLAYAIGTFEAYPEVDLVRVGFIQPKHHDIDFHDYTREEALSTGVDRLAIVISKAKAYRAGEVSHDELKRTEYCKYCKHIGTCPAVSQAALTVGASYAKTLRLPAVADPETWTTPEQFAHGLKLADVLVDWPKAVRAAAKAFAIDKHVDIPGYKLQERKNSRAIDNLGLVWKMVQKEYPEIQLVDFLSASKLSVGDLETLVKDVAPKGQKGKLVEVLKQQLFDQCLVRGGDTTSTSLVKDRKKS